MKKQTAFQKFVSRGLVALLVAVSLMGGIPFQDAGSLSFGTSITYAQVKLTDMGSHWSKNVVEKMVEQGAISGYPDGSFQPSRQITTAEFTSILGNLLKVEKGAGGEHWASPVVNGMQAKGIEVPEGLNSAITRNDVAKMLIQADNALKGGKDSDQNVSIPDKSSIPGAYQAYVQQAYNRGYIKGDSEGRFNGSSALTRAEAAAILNNLQNPGQVVIPPVAQTQEGYAPIPQEYKNLTINDKLVYRANKKLGWLYFDAKGHLDKSKLTPLSASDFTPDARAFDYGANMAKQSLLESERQALKFNDNGKYGFMSWDKAQQHFGLTITSTGADVSYDIIAHSSSNYKVDFMAVMGSDGIGGGVTGNNMTAVRNASERDIDPTYPVIKNNQDNPICIIVGGWYEENGKRQEMNFVIETKNLQGIIWDNEYIPRR